MSDLIIEIAEKLEREYGFDFDDALEIVTTYQCDISKFIN